MIGREENGERGGESEASEARRGEESADTTWVTAVVVCSPAGRLLRASETVPFPGKPLPLRCVPLLSRFDAAFALCVPLPSWPSQCLSAVLSVPSFSKTTPLPCGPQNLRDRAAKFKEVRPPPPTTTGRGSSCTTAMQRISSTKSSLEALGRHLLPLFISVLLPAVHTLCCLVVDPCLFWGRGLTGRAGLACSPVACSPVAMWLTPSKMIDCRPTR